jgi:hypothetical protein
VELLERVPAVTSMLQDKVAPEVLQESAKRIIARFEQVPVAVFFYLFFPFPNYFMTAFSRFRHIPPQPPHDISSYPWHSAFLRHNTPLHLSILPRETYSFRLFSARTAISGSIALAPLIMGLLCPPDPVSPFCRKWLARLFEISLFLSL